jgi:hypothetical protein
MPIYMNSEPPKDEVDSYYYCLYCESCEQTWNTPDIKELDHCIYKHEDWCHGHTDPKTGDSWKGYSDNPNWKTGPIHIYMFKMIGILTQNGVSDEVERLNTVEEESKRLQEQEIGAP